MLRFYQEGCLCLASTPRALALILAFVFYNAQVGQSSLSGKEELVLKGLDATRKSIDDYLAFFPKSDVDAVAVRVSEENLLNVKEFDPALGVLLNVVPSK